MMVGLPVGALQIIHPKCGRTGSGGESEFRPTYFPAVPTCSSRCSHPKVGESGSNGFGCSTAAARRARSK
jgi:hypothetical protein